MKTLQDEINKALAPLAEAYGINITAGGGKYGNTYATLKLQIGLLNAEGVAMTPEATAFQAYTSLHGLQAEDLGRSFSLKGKRFVIKGLNIRSRKIIAETLDGKQWTVLPSAVKTALESGI